MTVGISLTLLISLSAITTTDLYHLVKKHPIHSHSTGNKYYVSHNNNTLSALKYYSQYLCQQSENLQETF